MGTRLWSRGRGLLAAAAVVVSLLGTIAVGAEAQAAADRTGADVALRLVQLPPVLNIDSLWAAMEACTGRTADLSKVRWHMFTLDDVHLDGEQVVGAWFPEHNIYLLPQNLDGRFSLWYAQQNVAHEMVHELLRTPGHPGAFEGCGITP